jgi:hypothetical protein
MSRGPEQITVRASRRLVPQPEVTAIGPIHYEVIEPLRAVHFRLDENDCQPIAFDWTFEAAVPAFVEERSHVLLPPTTRRPQLSPDGCRAGMGLGRR